MGETHLLEPKAHRLLAEINLIRAGMLVLKCPRILRLVIPALEPESPYTVLPQFFSKSCVASCAAVVAHGLIERSRCRQNPHMAFRTRDGGVDEVPLQHDAVARI